MAARTFSSPSGSKSSSVTEGCPTGRRPGRPPAATRSGNSARPAGAVSRAGPGQVVRPRPAPVGEVDPLEEGRDDLAQLVQHHVGVAGAPRAADGSACAAAAARRTARCRRCRRWTASRPAAGRAGRRAPWPGPPGGGRSRSRRPGADAALASQAWTSVEQLAVGVEHPVHVADVAGAERRVEDAGVAVVAVVAGASAGCCRRCSGSTARGRP